MVLGTARQMHWSEQEYLLLEARSAVRHEFLDGEVFAMAGAKPEHNDIAAAITGALVLLLRGRLLPSTSVEVGVHRLADGHRERGDSLLCA